MIMHTRHEHFDGKRASAGKLNARSSMGSWGSSCARVDATAIAAGEAAFQRRAQTGEGRREHSDACQVPFIKIEAVIFGVTA